MFLSQQRRKGVWIMSLLTHGWSFSLLVHRFLDWAVSSKDACIQNWTCLVNFENLISKLTKRPNKEWQKWGPNPFNHLNNCPWAKITNIYPHYHSISRYHFPTCSEVRKSHDKENCFGRMFSRQHFLRQSVLWKAGIDRPDLAARLQSMSCKWNALVITIEKMTFTRTLWLSRWIMRW